MKTKKSLKGTYYFATYTDAVLYATIKGWPTDRIKMYLIGWAIQKYVSGPYYGPKDE